MAGLGEWISERLMHRFMRKHRASREQMVVFAWDYIGLQIMIHGTYEGMFLDQAMLFLEQKGVNTSGTYLDIGANIGNHSVYFSKFAQRVIAFEPNQKVFRLLALNTEHCAIDLHNFGLSDRDAIVQFEESAGNIGESRIVQTLTPNGAGQTIEVRKYDNIEFLQDVVIDVVKLDVELHEWEVLNGCRGMLMRCRPAIIFEQMAEEIQDGTSRSVELLRQLGYQFFYFGHSIDFPRGLRGFGEFAMNSLGQRAKFRPVKVLKRKSYNLLALPTPISGAGSDPSPTRAT